MTIKNILTRRFNVTKCICYDMTFEKLKRIMEEKNIHTIEELMAAKIVAGNCKLCVPYIKKMIETGQTKFEIILE